jgi:hypothetical protein
VGLALSRQLSEISKIEGRLSPARFVFRDCHRRLVSLAFAGTADGPSTSAPRLRRSPPTRPQTGWDGAKRRLSQFAQALLCFGF